MARRIGIYAGAFDPVHGGHVAFASHALGECGLDEVVFLPDRKPWQKPGAADIRHRLALLELAVCDERDMRVVVLEASYFTPRLAIPELKQRFGNDELVLLAGSDLAKSLHVWDSVDVLLAAVSLVIGLRGADTAREVDEALGRLANMYGPVSYTIIKSPQPGAASTRVRGGDRETLHPEVQSYIERHGLYGFGA
ncbi:adenylyltransferase/cytidyltransferase family protein [Candidatus Saccharibacteria bacterium]|nr:adenylyltransferase/cytidyltransferase family protein [Candidatus Saccharibacteria bacterium]